ncbi:MAG: hypothetical protein ACREAB_12500, partial [Blastocatellia bacterium]
RKGYELVAGSVCSVISVFSVFSLDPSATEKNFRAIQVLNRFLRLLKRGQREQPAAKLLSRSQKSKENLYELPEDFLSPQPMSSEHKITEESFVYRFNVSVSAGGAFDEPGRTVASGHGGVEAGWTEFARRFVGAH